MDQWKLAVLLLLTLSALPCPSAYSYNGYVSHYSDLRIDCGSTQQTSTPTDPYIKWQTDEDFIKGGENKFLPITKNDPTQIMMNTLRFFPKGYKNCYNLPLHTQYYKFLFRAGFYYGNYDGLSKPPRFRLEIDGHFWANVTASMSEEPVYREMLYVLKREQATVCLVQTEDDEVPFISSLEATVMLSDSYKFMDNNTALYLHSRINYGVNKNVELTIDSFDECCNRIWKSKTIPDYLNIHSETIPNGYLYSENFPPWPVMSYAIQASNVTDSIYLTVHFTRQTAMQAYLVLYFMDPIFRYPLNQFSRAEIYIDNVKLAVTEIPNYGRYEDTYHVVTLYPMPVVGSAMNVTISPAEGSTLAPLLNAMEVFSAIDVSKGGCLFNFSSVHFISFLGLLVIILVF